ncbi:hypothetical protein I3842_16G095000 [Carya illinoinensis]|uniref:N-acetylglucosaminylphosphatidylinositol deacetylase n=1 Tax=Carya illinoinensis TaxID=32201 RepID=A0A922AAH1_CARIL|nr:hypothetical protein I3842_16G095000 [Carya illinoinensis]
MAWVLIVCSLVLVLVACLCKILHGSSSPFRNSFLNTGGAFHKRNVLLVIAHPDDEFFSPTINYLTSTGHNLHVLCLSTEELYQACEILKVPLQQVKILDHLDLQDGFGRVWNHTLLANIIEEEIMSYGIDSVSTNILRKYIGPLYIWLSILHAKQQLGTVMHCLLNQHPQKRFLAMAQHSSQLVWFIKLFVAFSSYTYVNMLRKIECM